MAGAALSQGWWTATSRGAMIEVFKATSCSGGTCHFGVESAARAWAGSDGTVERIKLVDRGLPRRPVQAAPPGRLPLMPIGDRVAHPGPLDVRVARKEAGLTQAQAGAMVSPSLGRGALRVWQGYEAPKNSGNHREIPLPVWELFLLLTDQHPSLRLAMVRETPRLLR